MSYRYDGNGNLIQRTEDQNGKQRNIHWTEENRIARILDQGKETIFRYDDAGTRIVKRGKYGETVYVDPNFSIRNGEVASKHVFAGSTRIATKMVMQENRTGASKKTYVRPPGSTGHSGRVPEKRRGNHAGWDKQGSSQPEKSNNGKGQEKQAEQGNNGKGQDKSEKTSNGKAKGQNKNDEDDPDPQTPVDLPGNSEQGLANALSHGQGNKYGIYKKLERDGYTVDDDGDIVVGDGGSPSPAPILNGNNSRPEEHQIYYYHGDHLGSSNVLTDRFGRNYEHLEYFPYGETWVEESRNQTNLPYKFTGKELDPETGLYYFGARYYDPQVSVWVSVDPILGEYLPTGDKEKDKFLRGDGGVFNAVNLNLYAYVHLNPEKFIDPDGKDIAFNVIFDSAAGGKGHGSLYFQVPVEGKLTLVSPWFKLNYGTAETGKWAMIKTLLGFSTKAGASVERVFSPPSGAIIIPTTYDQDLAIVDEVNSAMENINSGKERYTLYSNNCVDVPVDLVNRAVPELDIPNPWHTPTPKKWFDNYILPWHKENFPETVTE
jgi:RHS repeat-associated protein